MNTTELFPETETWNIDKLISDINGVRNKYGKGEISPTHQDYLCGALVGYNPKDISRKLGLSGDGKSVRTAFSMEINPYVRELLDYPEELNNSMSWQRACVLLEKTGYKNYELSSQSQDVSGETNNKEIEIIDFNSELEQNNSYENSYLDTNIYIERPPIEEKCLKAILQPGALIRIKAPQKMGKTLLLEKMLNYAREQGYETAKLDLKLADKSVLTDLKTFLQWLCSYVSDVLEKSPDLDKYWQDSLGINNSCTRYFQRYLLAKIDTPLVLAIDNFERLFTCEDIFPDFCLLLRNWYETAKQSDRMGKVWKKIRLVVVNSTEVYPTLDINRSPFNVGLAIDLPEFNQNQVEEMASKYQLNGHLGDEGIIKLMTIIGGHPYLIQSAIYNFKSQEISIDTLLNLAPTESGIFSYHLGQLLESLQADSQLEAAYKQVVTASETAQLNPKTTFKLHSLGLVKIIGNDCVPSCDLYRQYFSMFLN